MRQEGLEDLRKGQKLSIEICDNWGKAAAKNLQLKGVMKTGSGWAAVPIQSAMVEANGNEMKFSIMKKNSLKRTPIPRAALERALAERIKANQQCEGFLEIFLSALRQYRTARQIGMLKASNMAKRSAINATLRSLIVSKRAS